LRGIEDFFCQSGKNVISFSLLKNYCQSKNFLTAGYQQKEFLIYKPAILKGQNFS
jgi:hypothetical protein